LVCIFLKSDFKVGWSMHFILTQQILCELQCTHVKSRCVTTWENMYKKTTANVSYGSDKVKLKVNFEIYTADRKATTCI